MKLELLKGKAGIQTKEGYRVVNKGEIFEIDDTATSNEDGTYVEHLIKQKVARKVSDPAPTPVQPPEPTYTRAQVDEMIAAAREEERAKVQIAPVETPAPAEDTGAGEEQPPKEEAIPRRDNKPRRR